MNFQSDQKKWFMIPERKSDAKFRLFCFPFAGSGPSVFFKWVNDIDSNIELVAVQLPGREKRLSEPVLYKMDSILEELVPAIIPLLGKPFFFFGHSMGAILAYELVRWLHKNNQKLPLKIYLSGRRAPHLSEKDHPIHNLPDKQFIAKIREYGGLPGEILDNKAFLDFYLPILKADFSVVETYQYKNLPRVNVPFCAMGGDKDLLADVDEIKAWQELTAGDFNYYIIPGNHFFLIDAQKDLINILNKEITSFG